VTQEKPAAAGFLHDCARLGFQVSRDGFEFNQQLACAYAGDKQKWTDRQFE
jgi:hypothetical protein